MADLEKFGGGYVAISKQNGRFALVDQPKVGLMRGFTPPENVVKVTSKSVHFKRDFYNFFIIAFIFCLVKESERNLISYKSYIIAYTYSKPIGW